MYIYIYIYIHTYMYIHIYIYIYTKHKQRLRFVHIRHETLGERVDPATLAVDFAREAGPSLFTYVDVSLAHY